MIQLRTVFQIGMVFFFGRFAIHARTFGMKVEKTMNWTGVLLGLFMLFSIGIGFAWVIKLEFYVGAHIWRWVLTLGIILCLISLWIPPFWGSALVGIIGGSVAWGATELPDQEERVKRGIFPANPKRTQEENPQ